MRETCAIVNLRSGGWQRSSYSQQKPEGVVERWIDPLNPDSVSVRVIRGAEEGTSLALEALNEGVRKIIAVGGDGTINDVIQALQKHPEAKYAKLGVIPMGTANVLAHILGLPICKPLEAGKIIRDQNTTHMDLGRAGNRWFSLVAGVGFDGAVASAVRPEVKRRIGKFAYLIEAVRLAPGFPPTRVRLSIDGESLREYDAYLVLIANGGRYAGNYRLGDDVKIDDGCLDIFICLRRGSLLPTLITNSIALTLNRLKHAPGIIHMKARHIEVDSDRQLPIQLDGDAAGMTPTSIEILPGALEVYVPGL